MVSQGGNGITGFQDLLFVGVGQGFGMKAHHDGACALGRIPGILGVQGGIVADHLVVVNLGFPLSLPVVGVGFRQGVDFVRGLTVEMPGDLDAQPVQDLGAVFAGIHRLGRGNRHTPGADRKGGRRDTHHQPDCQDACHHGFDALVFHNNSSLYLRFAYYRSCRAENHHLPQVSRSRFFTRPICSSLAFGPSCHRLPVVLVSGIVDGLGVI